MRWNNSKFINALKKELDKTAEAFERDAVDELCSQLITHLSQAVKPYPLKDAKEIMKQLRKKRMFALMQRVADALMQSGQDAYEIRRQYAQSLIEQNSLTAASAVLDALVSDTETDQAREGTEEAKEENAEARGLKGRVYKQLYLKSKDRTSKRSREYFRQSLRAYFDAYNLDRATHFWHGINVVALLQLGQRDGIKTAGFPDPQDIARDILKVIEEMKDKADKWAYATAVEACVALNKTVEGTHWLGKYVKVQYKDKAQSIKAEQYADAFELGSTLRQFEEVWQLDITSEMGRRILPVLRAELLNREGGQVKLGERDFRSEKRRQSLSKKEYESIYGNAAFDRYQSLKIGITRASAVARIHRGNSTLGSGTGFLLKASQLNRNYGKGLVLLTNAHVISNDPAVRRWSDAMTPKQAVVTFQALGKQTYRVKKLLWSSQPIELDASVVLLDKPVKKARPYQLAKALPPVQPEERVFIIGHPGGGELSYSLQDNLLLDHQHPPGKIHYRTPTKGGSSGSPVFDKEWKLIGLHHDGGPHARLNKKGGRYNAHEGIWIRAIIAAIADSPEIRALKKQRDARKAKPKVKKSTVKRKRN